MRKRLTFFETVPVKVVKEIIKHKDSERTGDPDAEPELAEDAGDSTTAEPESSAAQQ